MRDEHHPLPPRPYLPPSSLAAVGACLTCAWIAECAWRDYLHGTSRATVAATCALLLGVLLLALSCSVLRRREVRYGMGARIWLGWLGASIMIASIASIVWSQARLGEYASLQGVMSSYELEIVSDASVSAYGASLTACVIDGDGDAVAHVRATTDTAYDTGDVIGCIGRFEQLDASEWGRSRFMRGEVASASIKVVISVESTKRQGPIACVRSAVLDVIDPLRSEGRALVAGIVCGHTSALSSSEVSDVFAATGLSHLVAVSGGHLAVIASLLQLVLYRMKVGVRGRAAVLCVVSVVYVLFCGAAPSAVRSAIMVCLGLVATGSRRRQHGLSALAITVVLFTVVNPGVVYDLGFQLSVLSVLFIALFGSYVAVVLQRIGFPHLCADALSLTLCAQWATVPLTVPVFGTLSLIAPIANIIVGPLMSALLVVGLVFSPVCALIPLLEPCMAVPEALANLSIYAARVVAEVPFASIPCTIDTEGVSAMYACAAAVYLGWWEVSGRLLSIGVAVAMLIAGIFVFRLLYAAPPSFVILDVGQGDSILIRDGPHAVLVDAGVDEQVVDALARQHVLRLDAVVITHWDSDHWGGLPYVLDTVEVDRIIVGEGARATAPDELKEEPGIEFEELRRGDSVQVGDYSCKMVWPRTPTAGEENAESVALAVRYGEVCSGFSALLTGDTEIEQESEYIDEVGTVDVLKLGHHGSAASIDDEIIDVLDPAVAVASAGEGNAYGHPTSECISVVEEQGADFLCTIDAGDISFLPRADGFVVRTQHAVE